MFYTFLHWSRWLLERAAKILAKILVKAVTIVFTKTLKIVNLRVILFTIKLFVCINICIFFSTWINLIQIVLEQTEGGRLINESKHEHWVAQQMLHLLALTLFYCKGGKWPKNYRKSVGELNKSITKWLTCQGEDQHL